VNTASKGAGIPILGRLGRSRGSWFPLFFVVISGGYCGHHWGWPARAAGCTVDLFGLLQDSPPKSEIELELPAAPAAGPSVRLGSASRGSDICHHLVTRVWKKNGHDGPLACHITAYGGDRMCDIGCFAF